MIWPSVTKSYNAANGALKRKGIAELISFVAESLRDRKAKLKRMEDTETQTNLSHMARPKSVGAVFSSRNVARCTGRWRDFCDQGYENLTSIIVAYGRFRATRI
jgi:hypothetical protein